MSVKMDVQAAVGLLVEAMREDSGLTQRELADKCGISSATICRIELGANVTIQSFVEVCSALGERPDKVLVKAMQIADYTSPRE